MDLIIELREAELDEVSGALNFSGATFSIRQNARGGDSISFGGNGGDAFAGVGAATGGIGGASTSAAGGLGGINVISVSEETSPPAPLP